MTKHQMCHFDFFDNKIAYCRCHQYFNLFLFSLSAKVNVPRSIAAMPWLLFLIALHEHVETYFNLFMFIAVSTNFCANVLQR